MQARGAVERRRRQRLRQGAQPRILDADARQVRSLEPAEDGGDPGRVLRGAVVRRGEQAEGRAEGQVGGDVHGGAGEEGDEVLFFARLAHVPDEQVGEGDEDLGRLGAQGGGGEGGREDAAQAGVVGVGGQCVDGVPPVQVRRVVQRVLGVRALLLAVDVLPGLRLRVAERVGAQPDRLAVLLVRCADPGDEVACEGGAPVREVGAGGGAGAGVGRERVEAEVVDDGADCVGDYLGTCKLRTM